jgi:transposase-like protein
MRSISAGEDRRVALLREFEGSGLSMAEFCRRREVGYSTMAAWRRSARRGPAAFVEVEPLESVTPPANRSTGSLCAELMLPAGVVLRVYQINPTGGQA